MNRILTTLLFTAAITAQTFGQCNATSQTVSTTSTSSICPDGSTSYTVTVDGSEAGFEYLLKDTLTNSVIDGPFAGTGNAIDFNTGNLTRTTTFEVLAQTPPAAGSAFNLGGGIGDFASTANAWDFDYTQGYTLEFVFNGITAPTNFYNSLFSIGGNFLNGNARNDDLEVYFQQNTQNLIVLHDRGQSSLQYNQYTSPASSTDVHIAIVFDPTLSNDPDKMKVYYDGVLQQQTNTDSQITTMTKTQGANWYVGAIKHQDFTNITDLGRGIFDEVRVWNYGRTDAEINANKASCVSASEQGLAHYYRFNTGSGFTAIDETGNGRNLDIVSSVFNNPAFSFWTTELITCASDCQVPMANTVTIGDLDAPTLSLSSSAVNLDLDATGNVTINIADLVISASDNCSDSSALVFTSNITSFTCDDLGVNPVFVTVTDESGNSISTGTAVNVRDVTAPTITLNNTTPLEFALDANTNEVVISTSDLRSDILDNCDASSLINLDKTTFTCADLGTQTITITARDSEGNESKATEDVVIVDNTLPTFTILNPTLELDANGTYLLQKADIVTDLSDNCSAVENITVTFDPTTFSCTNLGTSDFDFTVSDENGNTANATSRIAIVDRIAPLVVTQDLTITLDQNGTVTVDPMQVDNGTSDNCSFTLSLDISTFTTADLGANTVTLTALDAGGNTASATAVVTIEEAKDPQTITFSLQDDAMYGDAPLVLAASASSGLAVTYTVIGAGEIVNSNELQINGAGDIVVTASQIGNDTYDAATEIVETLSVTKANLTATAQDVIITYGSNDILSFSINYTGFVGDDDALVIDQVPTVSSAATVTSDAGVYDLVVSGGSDDNYEFNNVNGTFTIEKANQTIDFPVLTDVDLATTNQAFLSATSDAGLPIIYTVVVGSDIASISSATLTLTNTGTVSVEASQVGTTNYNAATAVTNTFQVIDSRKQDQTITFPAIANASYGNDPIALSATASSGLAVSYSIVSGDDASISGNMLTILGAGTVEIEASQAGDDGFNVADPIIQSLVIDPARITITPDDKEIVLGEDLPTFTYSYVGFVNGEDEMVFDFIPTVGSPTSDINAEGTYPIVVTQDAIATNYVFTNEEGTLEIVRPLSIVEKPNIIFYPNPVVDMIKVKGLNTKATYSIVGLDGKQIQSGFVTNIIDFSRIGSGTYLLIVKGENYEILQEEVIVKR